MVIPFYYTADVDGAAQKHGGPQSKTGGMNITIKQRDKGRIINAFKIYSYPEKKDGKLYLITCIYDQAGIKVAELKTEY